MIHHFTLHYPVIQTNFETFFLNNFRVRLPQRIDLDEQWDVALVEAIYPHTWNNVESLR